MTIAAIIVAGGTECKSHANLRQLAFDRRRLPLVTNIVKPVSSVQPRDMRQLVPPQKPQCK